ncbi:interferon-induced GTP-binding protein Mx1-like [Mauremys reevesii]|uniref:interferon-induced GTP-binding protein Mx1-like n=1 Tax=Mauremys reevesii TaxID=260615 RepID=UPI00193FAB15|nr:interferon-induced GTP-binding protein Mx1-like [Mauremys reevesii]XP_039404034.1 interferon-induced GTP-binding protein Mx1-like [Mauremys reevesii]XP_039404045.1 interferon-induced GTP-binding protein Mx1-like [Mauremys reevesii]
MMSGKNVKGEKKNPSPMVNNKAQKAELTLCSQYEEKVRPCIDLIDSLRALGVEKDLGLPAIAVIGDQSSGKSSVLEALSGVALPRGSGIVTRCPLELKLKKVHYTQEWKGKITYLEIKQELNGPSEVEKEIRKAQDAMAGEGVGISQELISLEISSPNVPDLTLIDLPGIARVAVGNQPKDIGNQIINLIKKYICKQQTINLVVVPSNVDIATTEALRMAKEVDPKGERTLGILTKPDLVDRGTESNVVDIVRNLSIPLRKGYMIVKCRGQQDIHDNLTLASAIQKEREFFEEHEYFSILLEERKATIPLLAEKLTQELIEHINKSLPTLENQIKDKLRVANNKLQKYGQGVPESVQEQMLFLVDKLKLFNQDIMNSVQGEEIVTDKTKQRLFTKVRKYFNEWEAHVNNSTLKVKEIMKEEVWGFENHYRGRELPGFVNYKTFETIVKQQIVLLKSPAIMILKTVTELVRETFTEIAMQHFENFFYLFREAKTRIEDLKQKQEEEAETVIANQFKMERIVYCQDSLYSEDLQEIRKTTGVVSFGVAVTHVKSIASQKQYSIDEMAYHLNAYFKGAGNRLSTQIPLIIQSYVLQDYTEKLQNAMLQLLQDKDRFSILLLEKKDAATERKNLKERIKRLTQARQRLAKFPG